MHFRLAMTVDILKSFLKETHFGLKYLILLNPKIEDGKKEELSFLNERNVTHAV